MGAFRNEKPSQCGSPAPLTYPAFATPTAAPAADRPIPRAPALFHQFLIDVRAIRQDHISKGALVLVVAVPL
jgi:hypothetical protein